jgi:hypothetical protein
MRETAGMFGDMGVKVCFQKVPHALGCKCKALIVPRADTGRWSNMALPSAGKSRRQYKECFQKLSVVISLHPPPPRPVCKQKLRTCNGIIFSLLTNNDKRTRPVLGHTNLIISCLFSIGRFGRGFLNKIFY